MTAVEKKIIQRKGPSDPWKQDNNLSEGNKSIWEQGKTLNETDKSNKNQ